MENASKALLIAGGVLVAIIIITLAVTLYITFSNHSKEYNAIMDTTQIQKFNSKFEMYLGRNDISAQEVISAVNLAKEYNGIIEIWLGSVKFPTGKTSEDFIKENFISEDNKNITFSCKYRTNDNPNPVYEKETGKILKITFTKNT